MLRPVRWRKWVITQKMKGIYRKGVERDRKWRSTPQHLTGLKISLARPQYLRKVGRIPKFEVTNAASIYFLIKDTVSFHYLFHMKFIFRNNSSLLKYLRNVQNLLAEVLKIDYFFAHSFSAWERGTNENTNGLIREYFPKHSAFNTITQDDVAAVMDKLNNRARKCLGFKTPIEVYQSYSIALTC